MRSKGSKELGDTGSPDSLWAGYNTLMYQQWWWLSP